MTRPRTSLAATLAIALALTTLAASAPSAGTPAAPAQAETRALASLTKVANIDHVLRAAYPSSGTAEPFSTPAVGDITGDGVPEIVTATLDGYVIAYRGAERTRLWARDLGRTPVQASPVIRDLENDGRPEIVVATMSGTVLLLDGRTGGLKRTFREGAPLFCPAGVDCRGNGFFATPAVGDVDGDGFLDIVAASYDHTVYAWRKDGRLIFRRYLNDTLWSSPVIADIDGNGSPEIVLGGDISAGDPMGFPAGGLLWVLRRDGSTYPGYPYSTPGQTIWSSPAVADLNRDGRQDIVFGSGTNWADPAGWRVHAITARTAGRLPGWPVATNGRVFGSPALGDLDGNGTLEVSFSSEGDYVYAYNANGSRRWIACNSWTPTSCAPGRWDTHASTSIADVDADGRAEVVSTLENTLRVYDGASGALEDEVALDPGNVIVAPPSAPTVAEVGGRTIIVQQAIAKAGAHAGAARAGDTSRLHVITTGTRLGSAEWSTFHGNPGRTGRPTSAAPGWAPMLTPGRFVDQQYRDFLGREPDVSGAQYWSHRVRTGVLNGSQLIEAYLRSAEFGKAISPVVRAYVGIFGTYPTAPARIRSEAARIRAGATPTQVADAFAQDAPIAALTDRQFASRVFTNLIGRAPGPGELDRDEARLQTWSRGRLVAEFAESTSTINRLRHQVDVTMIYLGMLNRAPDAGGFAYWVGISARSGPQQLITGFRVSSEYRNRVT